VINMLRQVGLAVGVAILIALLGSTAGSADPTGAFELGWAFIAAASLLAAVLGLVVLRPARRMATVPAAGVVVAEGG
jgi:hypothetical protein